MLWPGGISNLTKTFASYLPLCPLSVEFLYPCPCRLSHPAIRHVQTSTAPTLPAWQTAASPSSVCRHEMEETRSDSPQCPLPRSCRISLHMGQTTTACLRREKNVSHKTHTHTQVNIRTIELFNQSCCFCPCTEKS